MRIPSSRRLVFCGIVSLCAARFATASDTVAGQADELETILVTASADASAEGVQPAYAGGQVARGGRVGIFGSQDIMNTPFSITNYTQKLIADQQAASVGDVLQNDPAVRVARGFGNFQQLYIVRGLPVYSDDMSYNGLYGLLPRQYLAAELLERVEVLHGASAFLNGAAPGGSGLGGAVNVSPKRAPNAPLDEFTIGYESGSQKYVAADVARRFGAEENLGVRFNAVRRDGGTAVDGEHRDLTVFGLGLDYHIRDLRVSADVGYQDHDIQHAQPSITPVAAIGIPAAPDASLNQAQPWTFSDERDVFGTVRAEFNITSSVTAWIAGGMRDGHERATFGNPTVLDDDGTTSTYRFDNRRRDLVDTGEVGIRAGFTTGAVTQRLIASVAAYQLNSKNAYAFSSFSGFGGNLYAPAFAPEPSADFFTGGDLGRPLLTARTKTSSAALADQLGFIDDRVILSVGARYQKIESFSYDYGTGDPLSAYSASRVTPVAGIVAKLAPSLSLYANYIEGLVQGDTAPDTYTDPSGAAKGVVNAGEIFKPYATRQGEVGAKWDAGRVGGSLSVFYTTKPVASVDLATSHYEVTDHQRNRGAELSMFGEPITGLRVLGGASYLNAVVAGDRAIGAPRWQADLGLEWDLPQWHGFTVDGRILETAAQYADTANTQEVPSWWRLDLGARYVWDLGASRITTRARVDNVTNRNEWVSVGGYPGSGYLVLGAPRSFIVSSTIAF
jgi:iron complex outermembrane receptor protein